MLGCCYVVVRVKGRNRKSGFQESLSCLQVGVIYLS